MPKSRNSTVYFTLFLKGILMGAANKVPGVSGGMVALVTGFYKELIYSFKKINFKAFKLLISGRFKSFVQYTNLPFLLAINAGSVFSFFSASLLLDYLLKIYEKQIWGLFFGLIVGSVYYIWERVSEWNNKNKMTLIIGVLIGLFISFSNPQIQNDNYWFVFICGIISVSGMTLPGLSGSFILLILGNYTLLLVDSVNALYQALVYSLQGDFSFWADSEMQRMVIIAVLFGLGSLIGLISFSHLLAYLLKRYDNKVIALLIGFIIGSLGVVWPWKEIVYKQLNNALVLDAKGNKIPEFYQRYWPKEFSIETFSILSLIIIGILILVYVKKAEKKQ